MALVAASMLTYGSAAFSVRAEELDPPAYVYLTWARDDTAHSINVSWRTMERGYLGEVRYDTEPRGGNPQLYRFRAVGGTNVTPVTYQGLRGYVHHVELIGLEPDTVYYFIAGHSSYGWSEERAFRTGPAERASFRFVEGSDSQRLPPD
ncbi:MAG: fibronectin type III domain-containing protein [Candidatus Hodarchaeaceae archaeon]|nr:fibronectin type III domain-containing protein [Candidatus Hodarchaeaceae archaeon]